LRRDILEKLGDELGKIDRPGSFCVSGSVPAVLPGLEVEGLGPVGLPLTAKAAEELIRHCDRAPYGKGEETLVDTKVRRVWKMDPGRFSLTNPAWNQWIGEAVAKVQVELGLEKQKLESHLHDLLVYQPGSFFLPHRDGEKLDRMVATLVVVLPSNYEGGELVVRHDGEEKVIDFPSDKASSFQIHFAAFYADCEHEVRPIRKGYRLCLVYNLTLARSKKTITAPRVSEHLDRITTLVRDWSKGESAGKLVITLDHQYTKGGLTRDALKGVDRVKAQVLFEAARTAGCRAYLGLLTFHESGEAEYSGSGRSRGYRRSYYEDYDSGDASDYKMGEIYDSDLSAEHLSDSEGQPLPIGNLSVEKDDLLDREALTGIDPEVEFEGYTGNAGMTLDHWYRHAAIFLWPERLHFEILCDRDSRTIVPALKDMVARWKKAKTKDASLKSQCLDLASAILAKWTPDRYSGSFDGSDPSEKINLLTVLDDLDAPTLMARFLGEVVVMDVDVDPGKAIVTICQKHGWGTFQAELQAVMKQSTLQTLERNTRLLEAECTAKPGKKKEGWTELCVNLAEDLITTLESLDEAPPEYHWQARSVKRAEVLAGLVRSLIATEQSDLLAKFLRHAQASRAQYELISVQIPALNDLQPWLAKNLKKPSEAMTRWVASCVEQLETRTAREPQPFTDFRRPASVDCKCKYCNELKEFLDDPTEAEHRFRYNQEYRTHLEQKIQANRCDLDLSTDRKGSPHTLVARKNTASYHANLRTYHENQKRLTAVRSLEAALP
jgi:predicted 2-oxoglutarate/Fe(II)-dependent dioxygenase YbiX